MTAAQQEPTPACPVHDFTWHKVIPDYRLGEGQQITEFGRSSGMNTLPLAWDR